MSKKNLAVFFGGVSSEHEVSRWSVCFVIDNISEEKYNVIKIGITKNGQWLLYDGPVEKIKDGSWEQYDNKPVMLCMDRSAHDLIVMDGNKENRIKIDVAFPVLHGKNGEDGTIQGLFQLLGIPFVGCDMTSSSACMDKVITNVMLSSSGVKKAKFTWFWGHEFLNDPEKILSQIESSIAKYPMFVKPANAGSSVGVTKVSNREQLKKAICVAMNEDSRILVEEEIKGQEVECAVLGNDDPVASIVGEIANESDFYDYESKYVNDSSKLFIPARVDEKISDEIRKTAIKAYKVMGCAGLSRIDFFVKEITHEVLLNEINTLPGFTSISMYPKLFEASGVPAKELIENLIGLAFKRCSDNE